MTLSPSFAGWARTLVRLSCATALAVATSAACALELRTEPLDNDTSYLVATGEITQADVWVLGPALAAKRSKYLVLDSVGGDIDAALELGNVVRHFGWDVYVPSNASCVSACIFIFVGGVNRDVGDGSVLGVHQFYGAPEGASAAEVQKRTQALSADILDHLITLGIDPAILSIASRTAPDDMYVFTREELDRYRLTRAVSLCPFPDDYDVNDPLGLYPGCK